MIRQYIQPIIFIDNLQIFIDNIFQNNNKKNMFSHIPILSDHLLLCPSHNELANHFNTDSEYINQFNNGFMCYQCIDQYQAKTDPQQKSKNLYSNEVLISLKFLLAQIFSEDQSAQKCVIGSSEIEDKIMAITQTLQHNQAQFENWNELIKAWMEQCEIIRRKVLRAYELRQLFEQILKNSTTASKFQQEFTQYYMSHQEYFTLNREDFRSPQPPNPGNLIHTQILQYLTNIFTEIQKLEMAKKLADYAVLFMFTLNTKQGMKLQKYSFSEELMGSCISLVNQSQAEMQTSGSQRVVIMNPCLSKTNKIKRWKIEIVKLASWIGVGVCHIEKIKEANFHFNYSNTSHGSYFVSSNGYSWSSYKPEYNSKFEPFTFKTGDIIKLQFNPQNYTLTLEKQGTDSKYSLQIEKNSDKIHPAVNLTGIGDHVKVIK